MKNFCKHPIEINLAQADISDTYTVTVYQCINVTVSAINWHLVAYSKDICTDSSSKIDEESPLINICELNVKIVWTANIIRGNGSCDYLDQRTE